MVEMLISVEMAILSAGMSVQREMIRTVQWLSFLTNVAGGSTFYTWRGALCQSQLCPISMWFPISLVWFSCISSQLLHLFPSCLPACTRWLGVSRTSLLIPVVNNMPTPVIVVLSLVLRLLDDEGGMVGIFCVMWMQLSQETYFFPSHLANPRNCVDSIFSNSFHYHPCNGSPPFSTTSPLASPSIHHSHHCLDGWSAGTRYAESKYQETGCI